MTLKRSLAVCLALFLLCGTALAARSLRNLDGQFNGTYKGTVKIFAPDKEVEVVEDVSFDIEEAWIKIYLKSGTVKKKFLNFFDYGYKREIDVKDYDTDTRYLVIFE